MKILSRKYQPYYRIKILFSVYNMHKNFSRLRRIPLSKEVIKILLT
eukprot:UN19573